MFEATHSIPDAKAKKYDRQLRMWGDHGQLALECAKVCLINCDSTGVEILKNLVLPGVGSFTIVDDHVVTAQDVTVNFFLTEEHIGKLRGECVTELLKEMNPDVAGISVAESTDSLLDDSPDFFSHFQLVIVMAHSLSTLLKLATGLWHAEVPLLVVQSCGMVAMVRLVVNEHTVIETHPGNRLLDLQLDHPFPELLSLCHSISLTHMTYEEHSHVPWLLLMRKFLSEWQQMYQSSFPCCLEDKKQVKELLTKGQLRHEETGKLLEEENFEEALRNANVALLPTTIPNHIRDLFKQANCSNIHSESKPFWIMLRALKDYVDETGRLPLSGHIPDMISHSDLYIRLQQLYRFEAARQADHVMKHVERIMQCIGRDEPLVVKKAVKPSPTSSPARPEDCITADDVSLFCKSAAYVKVVQTPCLQHQMADKRGVIASLVKNTEWEGVDELSFLLLFSASLRFHDRHNRHPGEAHADYEADIAAFKACVQEYLRELHLPATAVKDDYIHEFCRFGRSEVASVGGMVGGVVAQEAIKLLTHQFVPLDNSLLYNAIHQSTRTFRL